MSTRSRLAVRRWSCRAAIGAGRRSLPLAIVPRLVVCALCAPVLAPRSPVEGSLGDRLIPPIGMEGGAPPIRSAPTATAATC